MNRMIWILGVVLLLCAFATSASAQTITLSFAEGTIVHRADGRSDLVPNPDLGDFPSVNVWVIAYDIPEVFGYEYNLSTTDLTAVASAPEIWPSAGSDFATLQGDVRVGTGICFAAGDAEAGPDPTHIRLAKHSFTWILPPPWDVFYCIHASQSSVNVSGARAPQYTQCVQYPVSLPFRIDDGPCGPSPYLLKGDTNGSPYGCIAVLFEWEPDGVTATNCPEPIAAPSTSWGALKAAF